MKKSLTVLTLAIVNLILLSGLLQAGIQSNNTVISGVVYYANTSTPAYNATVKLYLVNPDLVTYKTLGSVNVNHSGEFIFTNLQISDESKIRIGAYVNDILENDALQTGGHMQTDEAELGAYANDLTVDCARLLSDIYNETIPVNVTSSLNSKITLYIGSAATQTHTEDYLGGGIGTYPKIPIVHQNYPNPFNPTTNIQFGIPEQAFVSLKVFDMSGKMVAELVNEVKEKGNYTVKFDGTKLASGFYIYKLTAGEFTSIKKMSLIK